MDDYDKKYGIDSSIKAVGDFHRKRIMFGIKDDRIYVAPKRVTYTHAVWFEKLGWITPKNDSLMKTLVRGFVFDSELYFYVDYDFKITSESEKIFFSHIEDLAEKLALTNDCKIFGGMIKGTPGEKFKPVKDYGELKNLINRKK